MSLLIKNGKIVTAVDCYEADVFVEDETVSLIGKNLQVEADTVLCLVEAMKVMNEITAGDRGIVREILVKNGEPVEFGQPLFRIETE